MKRIFLLCFVLCLGGLIYAQKKNEINVTLLEEKKATTVAKENRNPFWQESGVEFTPHPTLPYVYTLAPQEDTEILKAPAATLSGCNAKLTYVGHDNEWAVIPEDYLPQTFLFYGQVSNEGDDVLTNVKLKVTVYNSSDVAVFTATSEPLASVEIGEVADLAVETPYSFEAKDNYYIEYEVIHDCSESSDNLGDNILYRWVQISDNVLAKFTNKIPIGSSNFLIVDGIVGMLVKAEKTDTLTAVSYKTYSAASAAAVAKAAVYSVQVKDSIYRVETGYYDDEWNWIATGYDTIRHYLAVTDFELLAKSDEGVPYALETTNEYYVPLDRTIADDQDYRGVRLEKDNYYVIGAQGANITIAHTSHYNNGVVWIKAEEGEAGFEAIRYDATLMARLHFGESTPLNNIDAGVKSIITPAATHAIPSTFRVSINVKNYGKQAIENGLKVYYQYKDFPVVEKTVDTAIEPFQTQSVTFDTDSIIIFYEEKGTLQVWTSLSGDTYTQNDTLVSEIDMVNPNYSFNFELPAWNFYSWNATASRNRFAPWKTVDEDYAPVKSIILTNGYSPTFSSMGAAYGGGNVGNSGRRSFQGITPALAAPTLEEVAPPHSGKKIGWVASTAGETKDWMISPKVKLNPNSSIELWAMALDGGDNEEKFKVLVSSAESDELENFVPVSGESAVTIPKTWTKFSYDISEYDNEEIYVAIQYCSDNQLFAVFDDIKIKTDSIVFADLAVTEVTSPKIILDSYLTANVANTGNKSIEDGVSLSYRLNNDEPVTAPFVDYPINASEVKQFSFPDELTLPVGKHTFKVWSNYEEDYSRANDTITYVVEINPVADSFKLTFEEFIDFSENFYPWNNWDIDGSLSYNLGAVGASLTYFKEWMPIGFIAFNPNATIPASTDRFQAYEGDKFGASIGVWNPTEQNDDWLISPKISLTDGFNYVKMMVKSSSSPLEKFRVLVSTTDNNPNSFIPLTTDTLKAPSEWTEVSFSLNDYLNQDIYVAVQCVSYAGHVFMIDNLEIVTSEPEKEELQVTEVLLPASQPRAPLAAAPVKVKIKNTGNQTLTPVSISIQLDNEEIITENYTGEAFAWNEEKEITFDATIDISEPGIRQLKVWVNYETVTSNTYIHTIYINELQNSWFIDFEDAYDFTTVLTPWSNIDVDNAAGITLNFQLEEGSFPLIYPGYDQAQAFVAFNPSTTSIEPLVNYIHPKSGDRVAISVKPAEGIANDWFISPKVTLLNGNSEIIFWTRGLVSAYTEKFNVLVSTTDLEPSSFTSISGTTPVTSSGSTWTERRFSLNDYQGQNVYIAIQCVTDNTGVMFLIDDIEIATTTGIPVVANNKSIVLSPNPTKGLIRIQSVEVINDVIVFNSLGEEVKRQLVNATNNEFDLSNLKPGVYFIRIHTDKGTMNEKIIKN
jgi:hypothetical protein